MGCSTQILASAFIALAQLNAILTAFILLARLGCMVADLQESAFLAFSRTQAVGGVTDDSLVLMRGQARLLALLVKLASLGG